MKQVATAFEARLVASRSRFQRLALSLPVFLSTAQPNAEVCTHDIRSTRRTLSHTIIRCKDFWRIGVSTCALLGIVLAAAIPLQAQLKSKVTVDTSQQKAVLYTTSIGIAADRWEANAYDSTTLQSLQDAAFTNLRFPGNNGIDALYHWSNGTVTNPVYRRSRAGLSERKALSCGGACHRQVRNGDRLSSTTV